MKILTIPPISVFVHFPKLHSVVSVEAEISEQLLQIPAMSPPTLNICGRDNISHYFRKQSNLYIIFTFEILYSHFFNGTSYLISEIVSLSSI